MPKALNYLWAQPRVSIALLLVINALVWLTLANGLSVAPDMADHWMWAQDLRLGYYEHPPMIALLIRSFAWLSADAEWALKLGTVISSGLVLAAAAWLQGSVFGGRIALLLTLLLLASTYFSLFAIFAHIQPLLFFWIAGLACAWAYARSLNANWLLLFGLVAGLGALAKYVYALLYLAGFIWLIWRPRLRLAWRSWQLWCAPLVSLVVFSPNLYWNASNEWASIAFHIERGVSDATGSWQQLGQYTIGHLFLFNISLSLPLWIWLGYRGYKQLRSRQPAVSAEIDKEAQPLAAAQADFRALLLLTALLPTAVFSSAALLGSHSDPLWSETAYLGLFMYSASLAGSYWRRHRVQLWLAGAFGANVVLLALVLSHIHFGLLPLKAEDDRTLDLYAWDLTGKQLDAIIATAGVQPLPRLVVAREYQLAGSLSLYLQQQPFPFTLEKPLRNQWGGKEQLAGQEHVLLFCRRQYCPSTRAKAEQILGWQSELIGSAHTEVHGRSIRTISVYRLLR